MFDISENAEVKGMTFKTLALGNELVRHVTINCAVESAPIAKLDSCVARISDWYDKDGSVKFDEFKILELVHPVNNVEVNFTNPHTEERLNLPECDVQKIRLEFKKDRRVGLEFQITKHGFEDGILDVVSRMVKQVVRLSLIENQISLDIAESK